MAINQTVEKKEVLIDFDGGIVDGKQRIKTKSVLVFSNATDVAMFSLGTSLQGLSQNALMKVKSREVNLLTEV